MLKTSSQYLQCVIFVLLVQAPVESLRRGSVLALPGNPCEKGSKQLKGLSKEEHVVRKIPGDGSCLFESLSEALGISVLNLKVQISAYVLKNELGGACQVALENCYGQGQGRACPSTDAEFALGRSSGDFGAGEAVEFADHSLHGRELIF